MSRNFGRAFANKLASEIIKEGNRKRRALQRTQQKEIHEYQKAVVKHEREKQAAIRKKHKETHVRNKKNEANGMTDAVIAQYDMYTKIFFEALESKNRFSFENFKKTFSLKPYIDNVQYPEKGTIRLDYVSRELWIDNIFTFRQKKRIAIIHSNELRLEEYELKYEREIQKYNQQKEEAFLKWKKCEDERKNSIKTHNIKIDKWKDSYLNGEEEAVSMLAKELIQSNIFDDYLLKHYRVKYISVEHKMIIEFEMKNREEIFYCAGYRYMIQSDEFRPLQMKSSDINERTKDLLIELVAAIFAIIFKNDTLGFISTVIVNGYHNNVCCVTGRVGKSAFENKNFYNENAILLLKNFWIKVYKQITKGIEPIEMLSEI